MESNSTVELADRMSKKRAIGFAVAAGFFLLIQFTTRPFFSDTGSAGARSAEVWTWSATVIALLLGFATGGRLAQSRQLRPLINDEVSISNHKIAIAVGYWVAMISALALY